ncbi:serine--tRNA ligase [Mycoplasma bradburyae]|uniref:Serine--tRNA ligase n=1 Tax=Mycoplasma bradburyae TaxID=2963128 RepID=A0AAW6HRH3_9MOLU|nr:serine--tRNA ligase [Mycoplasma bradburyae]MDC4182525.1 serine--tRNA ligase [Mycoplasma bradburyae]MDC4183198.1 serine--tRNA ligase [Mycoplasma bradburyae]UTS70850.1 serine--tRNA ligase [Mycoplasma bradburyae]
MLDKNLLKTNSKEIREQLKSRSFNLDWYDEFLRLEKQLSTLLKSIEKINEQKNLNAKKVATAESDSERKKLIQEGANLRVELEKNEAKYNEVKEQFDYIYERIPNLPTDDVPIGKDENENKEVYKSKKPTVFDFKPLAHYEIATKLDIISLDVAAKITGSRFSIYKKDGARLMRAIQQFCLDVNSDKYEEYLPPVIVNKDSYYGSGQFPKFVEDVFELKGTNYYLASTAEVQLVNLHRNEILNEADLPKYYTASTACFRSEAGSAGKDTKGLIRQHQFYKTELVKIVHPSSSKQEHEEMARDAEKILELLELPYRRIVLCTGDMGFSAVKTYDLEVWIPSENKYREISSISNCGDFQARRANIKFKDSISKKNRYVHTLNASALAHDRLFVAIVENYQQKDGSIKIPKALLKYFDNREYIK